MNDENAKTSTGISRSYDLRLYDHAGDTWITSTPEDAYHKVLSGKYTFESGIKIPVINRDGMSGEIDSDNAFNEFSYNGIRPLTPQISALSQEIATDKVNQRIYGDNPLDAFVQGALRATTLGLSDVAFKALDVEEGAAQIKQRNPGMAATGEIAGTVATLAGGGIPLVAKGAKAAGQAGAKAAVVTGSKTIAKAGEFAAEGAYFGLGQGISETALGDPDDLIDNIVSSVGSGVLFGGLTGVAFGAAAGTKPFFDKLVDKTLHGSTDVVNAAARKLTKKGLTAAIPEKQLAREAGEFVDDMTARQAYAVAGKSGVKEFEKLAKEQVKEAEGAFKGLSKDLEITIKGQVEDAQRITRETVEKSGKKLLDAVKIAEDNAVLTGQQLEAVIGSARSSAASDDLFKVMTQGEEGVKIGQSLAEKHLDDTIGNLRKAGDSRSLGIVGRLEAFKAMAPAVGNAADEAAYMYKLYNFARDSKSDVMKGIKEWAENGLANNTNEGVKLAFNNWRNYDTVVKDLKTVADRFILKGYKPLSMEEQVGKIYDSGKAFKSLIVPENRQMIEMLVNQIDQFGDEFKALNDLMGLKDVVKETEKRLLFQEALEQKAKGLGVKGNIDLDEAENFMRFLGVGGDDFAKKVAKLREFKVNADPTSPLWDRGFAAKKALGGEVSKEMADFEKMSRVANLMDRLKDVGMPGFSSIKGMLGGGLLSNPLGLALGLQKSNAAHYIEVLTAFEKASSTGAKMISKGIEGATGALTGKRMETAVKGFTIKPSPTLKERRAAFKELKKTLAASYDEKPSPHEALPGMYKALEGRRTASLNFLKKQFPEDPFELTALSVDDTGWVPSDVELSKFTRYLDAIDNPLKVLDNIARGRVSPEEVEVLKELYPRIYIQLQNSVLDGIIEGGVKLSYRQKVELATLFDIPTDYTLRGDFIARMQATINQDEGGRPKGSESTNTREIKINLRPEETIATSAQRLTHGRT